MIAVSACFLGENCKYNASNNLSQCVIDFLKDKEYIIICPEVMGGLSTPREPSEIKNGKVVTNSGVDVTKEFELGAKKALDLSKKNKVTLAILKANSPSCANQYIYDGNFNGTLIQGQGITAKLFAENNIIVINETTLCDFKEELCHK